MALALMIAGALGAGVAGAGDIRPHPVLSSNPNWAGALLIAVGGLFLAAIAVGLVVRFNAPREVPPMHSHDEPPGASHHDDPGG
jgi:hypothetical protein